MKSINSKYVFSPNPNLITVDHPDADIDINQLIEAIKYGYKRDTIESLRSTDSIAKYNLIKKERIPCVTLSGTFNHRDSKGLIQHSGLMQVDIDKVADYDTLFNKICRDTYTYVCFRSPGGKGLKAIVKVKPTPKTHREQFLALEIYYRKHFDVAIDNQCKDLARAMLLSFDPEIFCNPWAKEFKEVFTPPEYPKDKIRPASLVARSKVPHPNDQIDIIEKIIASLEKKNIDITASYENWIKVGFALCTTFGEEGRGYFHRIGRMYPRYTLEETNRIFTSLLVKNNGRTKLGTIIFLAKKAGVIVSSP